MPTSLTSSSFSHEWTYDVFLSFRGEDTRTGFTGNLYNALCEKGINTFIDDQNLNKGEEITPALKNAIQDSRIAIVIFSPNYASSSFCLEELAKITECIKHKGRLVWPVFYQVDPSDVRHQKGSYAEALAKHERTITDREKVKEWRSALQNTANLSGWHFKQQGYEYEFIGKIVQEVSKRTQRVPLYVAKYPVGLESRAQKVISLLDIESNDRVHMVGIYGTGGIGKTTLTRAIYNSIADQFESLCFLPDVRENSMKHGLVQLQEMLLYKLIGEKDVKLLNVNEGIPIIKSRLRRKKILLILDDIDKYSQIEALAGGLDWFGSGSRIILTTRNKHLLHVYEVETTFEVKGLSYEEALELFSWNAFKRKEVNPSYIDISNRVILYSNGLPLSLEIIGSDLFGKTMLECTSALETYERIPHEKIQDILKESPSKPSKRSRLWFSEDILHVFEENKGSDKTEIIVLHMLKDRQVQWDGNALKKMENLKILVIENAHFSTAPNHLPKSLRVLKWHGYPASSLPADFDPKELALLDLSLSSYAFENQPIMVCIVANFLDIYLV
ncbi:hypothetical protein RJT34_06804 [Clitoria ternatea]|uniref:TIR domain-containing protein n=1 Tax=Clitoria ternatea TaxID=43366 RepID=A0AAN9K4I0_CLITE